MSNSLWPHGLYSPWNSPGQNTGVGNLSLLQGIFPTQGLNLGLPYCRRILYQLSHKGSPRIVFIYFDHTSLPVRSWFPDQGSNPGLQLWKCGVLTTGRPGKPFILLLIPQTPAASLAWRAGNVPPPSLWAQLVHCPWPRCPARVPASSIATGCQDLSSGLNQPPCWSSGETGHPGGSAAAPHSAFMPPPPATKTSFPSSLPGFSPGQKPAKARYP